MTERRKSSTRLSWRKGDLLRHKETKRFVTFNGWACYICGRFKVLGESQSLHSGGYRLHERAPK